MVNRRVCWVLVVALLTGASWAADGPIVGRWKLDPSRSKMTDQMKVENLGANKYAFSFAADRVETIVADGTDQPGLFGSTLAVTVEAPDRWRVVRKMQGRTTISAIWTLAADGSTLTDDFTGIRPDGSTTNLKYVYKRSEEGSGFAGTWESVSEQVNTKFELKVQSYGNEGLSFLFLPQQLTKDLQFDGKEYPARGPNVPSSMVSSARRINERAIEITDKIDGQFMDTQEVEVSPDHKALTVTIRMKDRKNPNVLVFDRE